MSSWPTGHNQVTAHVAGETIDGVQRCARCNIVLYSMRFGVESLWYPGQVVGTTDTGQVRMALRDGHGHQLCEAVNEQADRPAGV